MAAVAEQAPAGWDALTVAPPGGHVLQSAAWAEHRRDHGWRPRFVAFDDGRAALVVTRRLRPMPGFLAYAPRGPIGAGDPAERVAGRALALAHWLRTEGATVLVVDPVLDATPSYGAALRAGGFAPTEEIQPSRHRLVLPLGPGATEEQLLAGFAKTTRQRIRAAERSGTVVVEDAGGRHLDGFERLMAATAERKDFIWSAEAGLAAWWRRALAAGHAGFLAALHGEELIGGLLVYRQGGEHATAFSADRADLRSRYPGTMHLLRWTAIRDALRASVPRIDLGGVDLPGLRRLPRRGEPSWGMYEHKRSYGAIWVESEAAERVVFRPLVYRLADLLALARRRLRPGAVRG